tara:strand:+ start:1464 stop:2660 length:1197 start_codon:yes stop_codon:yes gene_type:complete
MKKILLSITFLFLFISVHADWLSFRGSNGNGSSDFKIPDTISLNGVKSWSTDLPGRGLSSPVVVDDSIFLTASSGPSQKVLHILAFNSENGRLRWERKFKATGRTVCHNKTSVAASTLASDGQVLIAQFSSNDVFCLDLSGNLKWVRGLAFDHPNIANGLGMSSSPVIAAGTAIIQAENDADSFSFGLDLGLGTTKWKKERPRGANWTSPITLGSQGRELVALQSKQGLIALEPETGQKLWSFEDGASTIPSSSWTEQGILLIPSNGMTALKLDTNMEDFKQIWADNKLKPGTGSPCSRDGKLYVINSANVLTCASVKNGEIKWRLRLQGPISGSPILTEKKLVVFSESGLGQVVKLDTEEPKVIQTIDLEDTILCTPAMTKDALVVRSDQKLWKLSH